MFKQWKNIRLRPLLSHLIVTLAYPAARAFASGGNRLQIFTDALTIIALVLVIGGVAYSAILHGDFDVSAFVFRRGYRVFRRGFGNENTPDFAAFKAERDRENKEAFNYPLFLGIAYLLISALIAYILL